MCQDVALIEKTYCSLQEEKGAMSKVPACQTQNYVINLEEHQLSVPKLQFTTPLFHLIGSVLHKMVAFSV